MKTEMEKWETEEGVNYLRKIGIRTGDVVLDFGARIGHYSIPAAIIVGNNGLVYAIDKEQASLNKLEKKAKVLGLRNIKIIKNSGGVNLNLQNESIDTVLLYDMLHSLNQGERKIFYSEVYRVLKPYGLLSVYPKHVIEDFPLGEFQYLYFDDVKQEIEDSSFLFNEKLCGKLSHDDELNSGCVLNFKKHLKT